MTICGNTIWQNQLALATLAMLAVLGQAAIAQEASGGKLPKPKDISLETKDGVSLKATYYGSNREKEAVPIIILHDYKGNRRELGELARWMQTALGHAVMVPDLRGHGDSTEQQAPGGGRVVELDAARLRRDDFLKMILFDMEAVRKFLLEENDQGKLNLNQLGLVGAGMGATVALNWTLRDWVAPPLAVGKQGQDVKGLVLVSPAWSFRGVPVRDALSHPDVREKVSMLIVHGKQDKRDAERIHRMVAKYHPDLKPSDPEFADKQDLFMQQLDTQLSGSKLLAEPRTGVGAPISQFLEMRLVKKDFEWVQRSLD